MSDMGNESAASGGNTWDYKDEPATPAPAAEPEVKVETPAPEGTEEPETEENKPWKAEKSETPVWARKRFKEYSSTVRTLKEENQKLADTVKEVLAAIKPGPKTLKEEDFETPAKFKEWEQEQIAQKVQTSVEAQLKERMAHEQEIRQREIAEARNVESAKADLPDYDEVISMGDPDIRLPVSVAKHLSISPAGPYVKYRLANDDALAERIKSSTPQEKIELISELHDSVLDYLIQKRQVGSTQPGDENPPPPVQAAPAPGVRTSTPPRKGPPAPPKAPPSVRSKGEHKDLLSLSGDDFAREWRERKSKT